MELIGSSPRLADGRQVPISPAVRAGNLIFLSGQLGLDDGGRVVSDDIAEQTRQCLKRLAAVLAAAGGDLSSIAKANIWITRAEDFPVVNQVWEEYFGQRPPARSTVVSALLVPGAYIEIDAIAVC
jgi:2-iminobutanoate/2-iminopropanoate deaminase